MSKTLKAVGITVFVLALTGGAIAGGMLLQKNHDEGKIEYPWETSSQSSDGKGTDKNDELAANGAEMETAIKGSGIILKALTSGVNDQGYATRTFGYTVSPANATDQRVVVSMSWVDTSVTDQISAFFSWSVNSDAKTITIACKQNFSHQALMTITSQSDSTKYGTVTVDCLKKLNGFINSAPFADAFPYVPVGSNAREALLSDGYQTDIYKIAANTLNPNDPTFVKEIFDGEDFVSSYSSTYTKDRDFTFSLSMSAPTSSWTLDAGKNLKAEGGNMYVRSYSQLRNNSTGDLEPAEFYTKAVNFGDSFGYGKTTNLTSARAAIQTAIDSLSVDTRNALHNAIGSGTYWVMAVKAAANLTVSCNETGDSKTYPVTVYYTDNITNYSFLEPVTSVVPEVTGIDF